jgi:predicted DNA-binding transcriptional regulator AlpA
MTVVHKTSPGLPNADKLLLGRRRGHRSRREHIPSSKSVPPRKLLTVEQFRREAQIGRATAYKLIASGEIPHIRIGPKIIRIPFWVLETLAGRRNPCT